MAHEKILFLGPEDSPLITWLQEQGEHVIQTADKFSAQDVLEQGYSFLVSYGYRHILRKDILGSTAKVAILLSPDQRVAYPGCSLAIEAHRQVCYACVCDQIADCGPRRAKWQIASFALLPF